jgi:hypothetical protein
MNPGPFGISESPDIIQLSEIPLDDGVLPCTMGI